MYKTLLLFISIITSSLGYAAIAPNNIMFTGVNTESGIDEFSFIVFQPLAIGEVIKFTDNAWTTASGPLASNEGIVTLTITSAVPAGAQLVIRVNGATVTVPSGGGTATVSGTLSLAENGDQIFAYQGTESSPTMLAGLTIGEPWITSGATTTNTSYVPSGIPNVALTGGNPPNSAANNNAIITTTLNGTPAFILAGLQNPANWSLQSQQYVLPPTGVLSLADILYFAVQANGSSAKVNIQFNKLPIEAYLEKSISGINFTEVTALSQNTLLFTINDILAHTKTYYRLKFKTTTGNIQYSEIISAYYTTDNSNIIFNSYPNPLKQQFYIPYNITVNGKLTVKIHNSSGVLVLQQSNAITAGQGTIAVTMPNQQAGMYMLEVSNGNKILSVQRIIKQ
jgi:hypothetical protein